MLHQLVDLNLVMLKTNPSEDEGPAWRTLRFLPRPLVTSHLQRSRRVELFSLSRPREAMIAGGKIEGGRFGDGGGR